MTITAAAAAIAISLDPIVLRTGMTFLLARLADRTNKSRM
jgi:hypothetical protein